MDVESIKRQQQALRETGNTILHDLLEVKIIVHQGLALTSHQVEQFLRDVEQHQARLREIEEELIYHQLKHQTIGSPVTITLLHPVIHQPLPVE